MVNINSVVKYSDLFVDKSLDGLAATNLSFMTSSVIYHVQPCDIYVKRHNGVLPKSGRSKGT